MHLIWEKAGKAPRETLPPWSSYIRSFWKTNFINPPEAQGQAVRLVVHGVDNDDAKVSKSPISVNRKIAESVSLGKLPDRPYFFKE